MGVYDLLIAGSGPAGLTAGIYAARGGLKTAIITGLYKGGKPALISRIENYSGVIDANGYELTRAMFEQTKASGAGIIEGSVKEYRLGDSPFALVTEGGKEYTARYVILAMGTHNKTLGLPNEEKLTGQGIAYCASCDGRFYKNKVVAVCGGGNTALTDALYLAGIAREVYIVHRRDTFKASDVLVERAKALPNVKMIMDTAVISLEGEPLKAVILQNVKSGKISKLDANGLFVAIGALPNTEGVKGQLELDGQGYIRTDEHLETSIKNVFAAGDIRSTPLRQIVTACGDGAIAAEAAVRKAKGMRL